WLIATFEHIASFVMSILTILIPVAMGIMALGVLGYFGWRLSVKKNVKEKTN
ncbi:MAG: hypothetical protein IT281_05400, partial [Ignavibacteria bacterium]|nr:hypothetical protein [Ignavibacteria bacterium]